MTFFTGLRPYFQLRSEYEFWLAEIYVCLHNLKGQKHVCYHVYECFDTHVGSLYNDFTGMSYH